MAGKKKLIFFDILCIGIGGTIGSGIFILMGYGIAYTGRSVSVALILGSVVMLLAYTYNIFLVSMFPFRGGAYSQMALLFTPTLTGVNAIFLLLVERLVEDEARLVGAAVLGQLLGLR